MEIKSIDVKACAQMKSAFDEFVHEVEKLCSNPGIGKDWLDNEDVCFLLNISKRTLQHYRDYGILPFSRIGNKCYYKVADIKNMIDKSQIK